jgi:hypothetical protein
MTSRLIARALVFCMAVALALTIAGSHQAKADGITTFNPGLPPQDAIGGQAAYMTAAQVHADYPGVQINQAEHTGFNSITLIQGATGPGGTGEEENFQSVLNGLVSVGGSPGMPFTLTGPVSVIAYGRTNDSELGTFNTQMLSMDLTGSVGGHSVEVMLDPNQSTLGQTTIAASGNMFHITSFFDVFTEISLDHGAFVPQINGPTVVTLGTIPEPSTFVMGAIAATVGLAYAVSRRRRARTERAQQ